MVVEPPSDNVQFTSSSSVIKTYSKSGFATEIRNICDYYFEMGETVDDRYPRSLPFAKCSIANCEDFCEKITYTMAVLKRNEKPNESLGIRTWEQAKEEVVIGYRFK